MVTNSVAVEGNLRLRVKDIAILCANDQAYNEETHERLVVDNHENVERPSKWREIRLREK